MSESVAVILRSLAPALPGKVMAYARNLGSKLARSSSKTVSRIFDGYIIHAAKRTGKAVFVTILSPEGTMIFSAEVLAERMDGVPDGFTVEAIAPVAYTVSQNRILPKSPEGAALDPEELDLAKVKGFTFSDIFESATAVVSGEITTLSVSPLVPHGSHVTRCREIQQQNGLGLFGPLTYLIISAFSGKTRKYPAIDNDGDFTGSPISDRLAVIISDNEFSGMLGETGIHMNVGLQTLHEPNCALSGTNNVPPQAFMLKDPVTSKPTSMLIVKPVVETSLPAGGEWGDCIEGERAEHRGKYGAWRASSLCGHSLLLLNLQPTEDEISNPADAPSPPSAEGRVMASFTALLTDYPDLDDVGQVFDAYSLPSDIMEPDNALIIPDCYKENIILQMSSAVLERIGDTEPETLRTLRPGERPDYYGATKIITAVTFSYLHTDPANAVEEQADVGSGIDPGGQYFKTVCTKLFTHELSADGSSFSVTSVEVSKVTQLIEWLDDFDDEILLIYPQHDPWPYIFTDNESDVPVTTANDTEFEFHYLYCATGSAVPMVAVTLSEWIEKEFYGTATIGQQVPDSCQFKLAYAGGEITTFNLGEYQPPRPVMRGGRFADYFGEFPLFAYDDTGIPGNEPSMTVNGAPSMEEATDGTYPAPQEFRVTELSVSTINQKIHAHIGNGKIAILVTPQGDTDVLLDWQVVKCYESTGVLTGEESSVIFEEQLPLESSNWISVTCLSEEVGDSEGNVAINAVLLCSLQRPRTLFDEIPNESRKHTYTQSEIIDNAKRYDNRSEQRISRDGGLTWELFLSGMPGDGYYLGNAIKSTSFKG